MLFPATLHFQTRRAQFLFSLSLCKCLTTTSKCNNHGNEIEEIKRSYSEFLQNAQQNSDLLHGRAAHAQIIKNSCISSCFLQNFLLNVYLKCGELDCALHLFDEMPARNVVSWSSLIAGFVQRGYPDEGLLYFSCMYSTDVRPNEFTLVSALNACSFTGYVPQAYQVYALVVRLGFEWNVFIVNAFMTALIRNGHFADAIRVFDGCLSKDIVSWNTMITGYSQFSPSKIPPLLLMMIGKGVKPDGFTFSTVLNSLAALGDCKLGVQVHGQLVKYGHGSETCVGNSVVDMYLKFGDLIEGFKAFHEITYKNVISWTTMATGCVSCGVPRKALELLGEMKMTGIRLNGFGLATTINACANMANLDEGKKAHGLRTKLVSEIDVCIDNALIDMYLKCGCMNEAMKVFRRMKDRTIITWTSMVMGFAQNGQAKEALGIFYEMVTNKIEPNYITFVCVLYACSQGGFVEEGWKHFSSMTRQYGIFPGEEHYACMVDLLGRTGQIREAEELISKMPVEPGPLIWQTLLGACHIHGDIEAGKRAAEHAMHLNKSHPSTYVLLSNMFAGFSHWAGSKSLRDIMGARNVNKMPGTSSLTSMDIV